MKINYHGMKLLQKALAHFFRTLFIMYRTQLVNNSHALRRVPQTTMFKHLDNSSEQNIRKHIGKFNNHFTKPADDENVIFTQPYIGSQGLGKQKAYLYTYHIEQLVHCEP